MDYFQLIGTLYEVEPAILQERIQELSNLLNVKDQLYQQVGPSLLDKNENGVYRGIFNKSGNIIFRQAYYRVRYTV